MCEQDIRLLPCELGSKDGRARRTIVSFQRTKDLGDNSYFTGETVSDLGIQHHEPAAQCREVIPDSSMSRMDRSAPKLPWCDPWCEIGQLLDYGCM
jgi:hypothetical protein